MKRVFTALLGAVLLLSGCTNAQPAVTEETTSSAETEIPVFHEFIYTTKYPDGTVFESYDGKNWYINGEAAEEPLIYIHAFSDNVYSLDSAQVKISVYNNGLEETVGTSGCGGILYYCYEDGEWDRAPYKENVMWTSDFDSLPVGIAKSFTAFPANSLETVNTGRYRYEIDYSVSGSRGEKEYLCTFEYSMK